MDAGSFLMNLQSAPCIIILLFAIDLKRDEPHNMGTATLRYCWRIQLSKGRSIFLKLQGWLIFPTEKRKITFLWYLSPLFEFANNIIKLLYRILLFVG